MKRVLAVLFLCVAGVAAQKPKCPNPHADARACAREIQFIRKVAQSTSAKPPVVKTESPTVWPVIAGDAHIGIQSNTSGRVDLLSNEEYAELQKLRQAVSAKETEIAKAHGLETIPLCSHLSELNQPVEHCEALPFGPHYEYKGQFLLINISEAK